MNSFKIGSLTLTGPGVWHCWKRGAETRGRDRCELPTWPSARTCLLSLLFIDCQNVTARGDLRNIPVHPSVGWVRKKSPALWRVPSLARGHMVGWRVMGRRATASASMPPVPDSAQAADIGQPVDLKASVLPLAKQPQLDSSQMSPLSYIPFS